LRRARLRKTRTILENGVFGHGLLRFVDLDPPDDRLRANPVIPRTGVVLTVFITAPSMTMPAVTYFQRATSKLSRQRHDRRLAQAAAVAVLRGRGTRGRAPSPADGAAITRRAGSSSFAVADCPIGRCPCSRLTDPLCQGVGGNAGISGDLSSVLEGPGKPLPTRGPPRNSGPMPFTPSNIAGGTGALVVSAASSASRSASTPYLREQQLDPIKFATNLRFGDAGARGGRRRSGARPAGPRRSRRSGS